MAISWYHVVQRINLKQVTVLYAYIKKVVQINKTCSCHAVIHKDMVEKSLQWSSLHLLTHLAMLSLYSNIVLNGQQQVNYISMTADWLLSPGYWHLIQHCGIGGFGKWDGLLILYRGLIKMLVYCSALSVNCLANKAKLTCSSKIQWCWYALQ